MKRTHMSIVWRLGLLALVLALLGTAAPLFAQAWTPGEEPHPLEKPGSVNDLANGRAIMTGGRLWDSFSGPNAGPYYGEAAYQILRVFNPHG